MAIDGSAGTSMYRFDGDFGKLDFLKYDVTNLAYYIRHAGRAAVIGVGGGRDILSAHLFGFQDITGVELNPIFIEMLSRMLRSYNHLVDLPGTRVFVDEARSWFARSADHFDSIEMSLVDTWASTGAGAFSLSENGLYTLQGWRTFFDHLAPSGVFTVSRWFSPANVNETGRMRKGGKRKGRSYQACPLALSQSGEFGMMCALDPRKAVYAKPLPPRRSAQFGSASTISSIGGAG